MIRNMFNLQRFYRTLAMVIALVCVAGGSLFAQTSTGNIRGHVTGPGGAAISDAQVVARLRSTNATRGTTTNESGFYFLAGLTPGAYDITVRRIGLEPQTRSVQMRIGETLDLDVATGQIATQLTAVEVSAARSGTTKRTSEVATNISREQISNLPNFERNVLDLAKLVPGISAQAVNNSDKFIAAGGQPAEAVNIFVDGATYKNDVLRGGVVGQDASKGNPFPQGAIDEFRVLTQNYKAEYQKAASVIIVATTKSGSNQTEADLFAYGVGKSYVAKDEIAVRNGSARPDYKRLQAGASLGGPIIKDKLFYFGTYELNFRDEPAYIRLGSAAGTAPPALVSQLSALTGQQAQQFREHLGLGKLTWNASEANTIEASFDLRKDDDFRGFGGQTAFEAAENLRVNTYTTVLNFKHAANAWLNEAHANYQSFTWNPTGRNFGVIGKNYFDLLRIGGKDTEQNFLQRRLSIGDDITRTGFQLAGDHVFKGGLGIDFLSYDGTKAQFGNPVYNFRATPENWATPFEAQIGFGNTSITNKNTQFGAFLQDDWSIGKQLVLNLGIRWDAETNMINNSYVTPLPLADSLRAAYAAGALVVTQPLPGGVTQQVPVIQELGGIERYLTTGKGTRPMYKKAFQPRLGASYALPDGNTVLFGGAGLYYDRNYWNTMFDEQYRRQFQVITFSFSPTCAPGAVNCAAWDPRFFDPAELRALGTAIGRPEVFLVANDMVPPRTLQMSGGVRHNFGANLVTLSYNGLRGSHYMNFVKGADGGAGGLPYNSIFVADDRVKSWFNALELQIQRPFSADTRWGGALAYTLAKSEEQGKIDDIFWGFDGRFPTVGDLPKVIAPGDQRHAIVANGIFKLPADFIFSSIVNLGSGIAFTATDASLGFGAGLQRSYTYQPPTRAFLGIGHVFGYQNMDVRLQKDIRFASRQNAAVLVDVFNVFNSDNFGCYDAQINPTNGSPNPNFGKPTCAGLGRRLQVGLRYGIARSQ